MRLFRFLWLAILLPFQLVLGLMAAQHTQESLSQIKENIDSGKAVLVDVRSRREWDAGHIDGAIFLPLTSLVDGVTQEDRLRLPKDKILYVHCVVGKRAGIAANLLERHGYNVRPMKPGYKEMIEAGFPKAQ